MRYKTTGNVRVMGTWRKLKPGWQATILCVLTIAILFARRPDQFFYPAIWAEDGTVILKAYVERGLASIIEPVTGYQIFVAKVISLAAFKISILYAPAIGVALVTAFTCAVIVAIAMSPTHLPAPFLCALAALLVPSAPEVFAIPLLAFWWAGLLLVVAMLWHGGRGPEWPRWAMIVVGGLSSPLIIPFSLIFLFRTLIERTKRELVSFAVAGSIAALQAATMLSTDALQRVKPIRPSDTVNIANFFAGPFLATPRNWFSEHNPGVIVLVVLAGAACLARKRLDWRIVLLAAAWILACASVAARIEIVHVPDPVTAGGPRYLFYPFILLSWLGIWIGARSNNITRLVLACGFSLALYNAGRHLTRLHDPIDWREEIQRCAQAETYSLAIHTNGEFAKAWRVQLSGIQCRNLIESSLWAP